MPSNRYEGVDPYAVAVARGWAKRLVSDKYRSDYSVDDWEQELLVGYLEKEKKFNRKRGEKKGFIETIMHDCAVMLMRESETDKRKANNNTVRLDAKVSNEGDMTLIDLLADTGKIQGHNTIENFSDQSIANLDDLYVQEMRASLDDDDARELFDALLEFTIAEIAGDDIPHNTVKYRAEKIGKHLIRKGFLKKK